MPSKAPSSATTTGLVDRVSEVYGLFVASDDDNHVTVHDDIVMSTVQLTYAKGPQADEVALAAQSSSCWTTTAGSCRTTT
ncbi:hypothetical protein [Streptomyces sp. NBC_01615]|uniref:hypothetical protein n=1 Tax=Streptomyces sp. NBC_01615 TaxID=2975898 RepID=UPI0038670FBC